MDPGSHILSQSPAWELQRRYFTEAGIGAWSKGEVPHYVTSNPVTARAYAELTYAFLCDIAQVQPEAETIYLLELGAGHGRFCYHFLKHLEELTIRHVHPLPQFCYVLSDIAEENIAYWRTHPRLQPYYEKGLLDHCLFDASNVTDIVLHISQKVIKRASLQSPLVVIANYFFDTIPQDLYFVCDKKLYECRIDTLLPAEADRLSAKEQMKKVEIREAQCLPLDQPAYEEFWLNNLLMQQVDALEKETYLLFPAIGVQCIDQLAQFSLSGLLLLTGDRGYHRLNEMDGAAFPQMARHGSFSYDVNYHAFKLYCSMRNGKSFFPMHRHQSIIHGCILVLPDADAFAATSSAYGRFINEFGPDDFYTLKQLFVSSSGSMDIPQLLSGLRLSGYDARFFKQLLPRLTELCGSADEDERWDIYQVVHRVWDMYFPLGEDEDLAFFIATLLFTLTFYDEALRYFTLSEKLYGYGANRAYNIALCHCHKGNLSTAIEIAQSNHDRAPGHAANKELLNHLIKLYGETAQV